MKFFRGLHFPGKCGSLRLSILVALVVAGIDIKGPSRAGEDLVVLLDVSESVRLVHERCGSSMLAFYEDSVRDLIAGIGPGDRAGVIYFGEEAETALALTDDIGHPDLPNPSVSGADSRIDLAFRMARAWGTGHTRAVVLSDGNVSDRAKEEIRKWTEEGDWKVVEQSAFPPGVKCYDVSMSRLVVPSVARQNSHVSGYVEMETSAPGIFRISITMQGREAWSVSRKRAAGNFRAHFSIPVPESGKVTVEAAVESLSFVDLCSENNRRFTEMRVIEPPRVLWIGEGDEPLDRFRITRTGPVEAIGHSRNLDDFEAIVVAEGDASFWGEAFSPLEKYVQRGGGLLVLGSATTLGPGGYAGTALESALPVWCAPRDRSSFALLVILDVSGSMAEGGDLSKLENARAALAYVLGFLSEDDLFALVAFRGRPQVVVPFSPLTDDVFSALQALYPQGGTNIVEALRLSLDIFTPVVAGRKHAILISDGMSGEEPQLMLDLVARMQRHDITFSVIATGDCPEILAEMARCGKGGFYRASQGPDLVSCLQKDVRHLQGDFIRLAPQKIRTAYPLLEQDLAEFNGNTVEKSVRIEAKDWGLTLLETDAGEPLLVLGYYGLGRSGVLATNLSLDWGGDLSRRGYGLVENVLAWICAPFYSTRDFQLLESEDGFEAVLDAGPEESGREFQALTSWQPEPCPLGEVDSGIYQGTLPLPEPGRHRVILRERRGEIWITHKGVDVVLPYSREYRRLGFRPLQLNREFSVPGGGRRSLSAFFLGCAVLLFLIERHCGRSRLWDR